MSKDIQLVPVVINPETGTFENVTLFEKLLPTLEENTAIFGDDSMPKLDDYAEWLKYYLEFVKLTAPWMFAVLVNGKAQGLCWAINWAGNGLQPHSVEIGGLNKRKTRMSATTQTIRQLINLIFEGTPVYIIRANCSKDNRAASLAMSRAGLSHPELQRASMIQQGTEIIGLSKSITRPEWKEAKQQWEVA